MLENFCSRASPTCSRAREMWRAAVGPAARVGRGGGFAPALPYIGGWAASLAPPPSPRAGGQGVEWEASFPPSLLNIPLGFPLGLAGWALRAWCAWTKWPGHSPLGPHRPPSSGPTMAPLWNLLEHSGTIPINSKTFLESKNYFLYMNLILRTIPEPLVISWISTKTPNKNSITNYLFYPSIDAR
jgi:hypothetical protein